MRGMSVRRALDIAVIYPSIVGIHSDSPALDKVVESLANIDQGGYSGLPGNRRKVAGPAAGLHHRRRQAIHGGNKPGQAVF